ncbi:hypothetical protein L202_07763 [Cryptococcus amylolentus CBS 6039]|uniref:Uncharacterized protein n=1 Tax=Cryptococcus amylolentus CBS 6039 TaxID=1295533 RepID=A0A1E3HA73_9TREE|nr:hypothetical protein L202_07763 [Cryptococcus amylolentus CBS 6039]ODN73204.1 hypothetical protein L202_07763 [Cryptococcus amylolentus CBS 6039]
MSMVRSVLTPRRRTRATERLFFIAVTRWISEGPDMYSTENASWAYTRHLLSGKERRRCIGCSSCHVSSRPTVIKQLGAYYNNEMSSFGCSIQSYQLLHYCIAIYQAINITSRLDRRHIPVTLVQPSVRSRSAERRLLVPASISSV